MNPGLNSSSTFPTLSLPQRADELLATRDPRVRIEKLTAIREALDQLVPQFHHEFVQVFLPTLLDVMLQTEGTIDNPDERSGTCRRFTLKPLHRAAPASLHSSRPFLHVLFASLPSSGLHCIFSCRNFISLHRPSAPPIPFVAFC